MNTAGSGNEESALRRELVLRILLQNLLLIFSVGVFVTLSAIAALVPEVAWALAFAGNAATLAGALQWCHHGVRTMQIKKYLLLIDRDENGWERWLPANRPRTLLGSRWLISTKGVFIALGLANGVYAHSLAPFVVPLAAMGAACLWGMTAVFLFTNPKE